MCKGPKAITCLYRMNLKRNLVLRVSFHRIKLRKEVFSHLGGRGLDHVFCGSSGLKPARQSGGGSRD